MQPWLFSINCFVLFSFVYMYIVVVVSVSNMLTSVNKYLLSISSVNTTLHNKNHLSNR